MLPNTICTVGVALAYATVSVFATSSVLSVRLSGPEYVNSIRDLRVVVSITNVGVQTIGVLNDPQGPLSTMATETFSVINMESGESPSFVGIKVRYDPEMTAATDAYTILKPGQTVTFEHDLSLAYDFTYSGGGDYKIDVKNLFYIVNPADPLEIFQVYADTSPIYTHVFDGGELSAVGRQKFLTELETPLHEWATYQGCSATQITAINSAVLAAQAYATGAYNNIKSSKGTSPRYTKWFGSYDLTRFNMIVWHFKLISENKFASYTYNCILCTSKIDYAYVDPDLFGRIFLCDLFWKAPNIGANSKAGTIIHEASHFTQNARTDDHERGITKCIELAKTQPALAATNADNYAYFAENA